MQTDHGLLSQSRVLDTPRLRQWGEWRVENSVPSPLGRITKRWRPGDLVVEEEEDNA